MNVKMIASSIAVSAVLWMSGCGSSNTTDEPVATGSAFYVDSAVIGVAVACGDVKSVTDTNGTFRLKDTESCTFSVADILLREEADLKNGDYVFEENIEIAQFLQSLDNDGDATNGIEITPEVIAFLEENGIDTIPQNDEELQALVKALTDADIGYKGRFVSKEEAAAHVEKTRKELYEDNGTSTLTADAGGDLRARVDEDIRLNGAGSRDPNSQIVKYEWYDTKDEATILEGISVTFKGLDEGTHTIVLKVTNEKGQTATDEMEVIMVLMVNPPPEGCFQHDIQVEAGIIKKGADVIYTGSINAGGTIFEYMWQDDAEVGVKEIEFDYSLDNYTNSPHFNYCENLTTGGYSDWRLPSADEFHIFLYGTFGNELDEEAKKCTYENSKYQQDMKSGFYAALAENIGYYQPNTGNKMAEVQEPKGIHNGVLLTNAGELIESDMTPYKKKGEKAFVRCVRYADPAQNVDWNKNSKEVYEISRGNFDRDDEREVQITNIANQSKIMLQDNSEVGDITKVYGSAFDADATPTDKSDTALIHNYCANLEFAKFDDWRLPTASEQDNIKLFVPKLVNKADGEYAGVLSNANGDHTYPYLDINGATFTVHDFTSLNNKDDSMFVRCVRTVTNYKPTSGGGLIP